MRLIMLCIMHLIIYFARHSNTAPGRLKTTATGR